jgi:predicted SAM-dependent methyltransferase
MSVIIDYFSILIGSLRKGLNRVKHHLKLLSSKSKVKQLLHRDLILLELGSGEKKGKDGWVTIDLNRNCDLYWDLNKGLPFPNSTITKIYSSHVFEHFHFEEIQKLLSECLRVLKPGGAFSICVPDAEMFINTYCNKTQLDPMLPIFEPGYSHTGSRIDYINYVAYCGKDHKYMFDRENLVSILKNKGFKNVTLRDFDPSLDLEIRKVESIYAQAEK